LDVPAIFFEIKEKKFKEGLISENGLTYFSKSNESSVHISS